MTAEALAALRDNVRAWAVMLAMVAVVLTLVVVQIARGSNDATPPLVEDVPTQTVVTGFLP